MHTHLSLESCVSCGGTHNRHNCLDWLAWLIAVGILVAALFSTFQLPVVSKQSPHHVFAQKHKRNNRETSVSPKYDCSGGLPHSSIDGNLFVEEAIDEALDILTKCESCRRMFGTKDPDYAIKLLKRLRRDKVILISESAPTVFKLSPNGKRLKVYESEGLKDAAAVSLDVGKRRGKEMENPCVYINPKEFIATGGRAENYALYRLNPITQRALAIIHELGHVAGILSQDGGQTEELRKKSVANTDCIRQNCISCKRFYPCLDPTRNSARTRPQMSTRISSAEHVERARSKFPGPGQQVP